MNYATKTPVLLFLVCLLAACTRDNNSQPGSAPIITKLELAQTHVIPANGKSWATNKLAPYNLHLVGNRDALLLVDLNSKDGRLLNPTAEANLGGTKVGEVALNPASSLPTTEANGPAYSNTTYWAKLDAAWIKPGLQLTVRANNGSRSATQTIKVGAASEFTIYTLPFYLFGLTQTQIPLSQTSAPDKATKDEYFAKHPFSKLNMINHPAQKIIWPYIIVEPRNGQAAQKINYAEQQRDGYDVMSAVLNVLSAMREANGDEPTANQYYAPLLMASKTGAYTDPGGGLGGGGVGTGDHSYKGVFIHEAGHGFGMPHAKDGYANGTYPYIDGSLLGSNWGYDQINNIFLSTQIPKNASSFNNCKNDGLHQKDAQNNCIKQDPMQSGSGDQAEGYKYTMFSDFNASVVQQYLEGTTTISNGKKTYDGGRLFEDNSSATGYTRWDSLDEKFVPADTSTTDKGIYGLDQSTAITHNTPVHSIIVTIGIDSIQDTFTETPGKPQLSYQDSISYNPNITQIYSPISCTGNLRRVIDPTLAASRASIVPNTSENPWYCLNSGCDYTLRVTYTDNTQQHFLFQGGFRGWFKTDILASAATPTNTDSYKTFGVNVPGDKAIQKIELLETPEVWKGFPTNPKIIASRTVN